MPKKIETEIQLMRMLSTRRCRWMWICCASTIRSRRTRPRRTSENFYHDFEQVRGNNYDGMIITGAPLGLVEFEEVIYWPRIVRDHRVVPSARDLHPVPVLGGAGGAQGALRHGEADPRRSSPGSIVYHSPRRAREPLLRGFDDAVRRAPLPAMRRRSMGISSAPHTDLQIFSRVRRRRGLSGGDQGLPPGCSSPATRSTDA